MLVWFNQALASFTWIWTALYYAGEIETQREKAELQVWCALSRTFTTVLYLILTLFCPLVLLGR